MPSSTKSLLGFAVATVEGRRSAEVESFLFDPRSWTIRYLVARTGSWLPDQRVLLSPASLGEPDWTEETVPVHLTRTQLAEAPTLRPDGQASDPTDLLSWTDISALADARRTLGAAVVAPPKEGAGRVADILVDTRTWELPYLVVERGRLLKKETLVRTRRVHSVGEDRVELDISLDALAG
jgi:sporulation protein YlmC with PRC-barrel domain